MKCTRCRAKAEVHLRAHNAGFCRPCYILFFRRQVERAIAADRMCTPEERVLVAISGGKDSLALGNIITALLNASAQLWLLRRRLSAIDGRTIAVSFVSVLLASLVMAVMAWGADRMLLQWLPGDTLPMQALRLTLDSPQPPRRGDRQQWRGDAKEPEISARRIFHAPRAGGDEEQRDQEELDRLDRVLAAEYGLEHRGDPSSRAPCATNAQPSSYSSATRVGRMSDHVRETIMP